MVSELLTFNSVLLKAWKEPGVSGLVLSSGFFTIGSFTAGMEDVTVGLLF